MVLTSKQLRKLIKEEVEEVLSEDLRMSGDRFANFEKQLEAALVSMKKIRSASDPKEKQAAAKAFDAASRFVIPNLDRVRAQLGFEPLAGQKMPKLDLSKLQPDEPGEAKPQPGLPAWNSEKKAG